MAEAAEKYCHVAGQTDLGVCHWMQAVLERHAPMAAAMGSGWVPTSVTQQIKERLKQGDAGQPLSKDELLRRAQLGAAKRGSTRTAERDLVAAILVADGYTLLESAPSHSATSPWEPVGKAPGEAQLQSEPTSAVQYRTLVKKPTPTLDQFGRDLTLQAAAGKLLPVVGREDEIELIIEVLCRRVKRNPVLVGPAGSGKTAIVEGLARRIARDDVPSVLKGSRLISLQPSSLVAGTGLVGELDKRMQAVVAEASQDGILLFIDEIHSVIGAGGREGSSDIASQLKPSLARGEIACLAATTDDEYRRFIEPDAALERRFQPVRIQEMTPEQALQVLLVLRDDLAQLRGVSIADNILTWLVDFASNFMRNRTFPDKAVDLLEQCVAYAVAHNQDQLTRTDAASVARRMVGMPLDVGEQLARLQDALAGGAMLVEADARELHNRLSVTMRGLDLRQNRPNAVVLFAGTASAQAGLLAETLAESLFGAADRVVSIDCGRMVQPQDVTLMLGAPPGYVGYSGVLPIHRVAQMPWCVLCISNIDDCHPMIRDIWTRAFVEGVITDATGKKIFLSDAVVLMTATHGSAANTTLGFRKKHEIHPTVDRDFLEELVGEPLLAQCDLIISQSPAGEVSQRRWLETSLLPELSERYKRHDLHLTWDESAVDWLVAQQGVGEDRHHWERVMETSFSPLLLPFLAAELPSEARAVVVKFQSGKIQVEPIELGTT